MATSIFDRIFGRFFWAGLCTIAGCGTNPARMIEGHERMGAQLVSNLTSLDGMAPALANMILFHSEAARLASRAGLLKWRRPRGGSHWVEIEYGLHKTPEAARAALKARGHAAGDLLSAEETHLVIPVAVAEYYLTHTEGFEAKSRASVSVS